MIRTQIQLPEADYEKLRQRAADARTSMAQQVREAIAQYLASGKKPQLPLDAIIGKHRPRLSLDDLKDHDRWFVEAVEERIYGKPKP